MTRQRITLHIDRVTLSTGTMSRHDLSSAIERELASLVQQGGSEFRDPGSASIRQIESKPIQGRGSEVKVGRAVAQAAYGAMKR